MVRVGWSNLYPCQHGIAYSSQLRGHLNFSQTVESIAHYNLISLPFIAYITSRGKRITSLGNILLPHTLKSIGVTFSSWRPFRDSLDIFFNFKGSFWCQGASNYLLRLSHSWYLSLTGNQFSVSKYTKEAVVELWVLRNQWKLHVTARHTLAFNFQ